MYSSDLYDLNDADDGHLEEFADENIPVSVDDNDEKNDAVLMQILTIVLSTMMIEYIINMIDSIINVYSIFLLR